MDLLNYEVHNDAQSFQSEKLPSFYELVLHEQFTGQMYAAYEFVFRTWIQSGPRWLKMEWKNEMYYFLYGVLQYYYLAKYNCLFEDRLMGYKRVFRQNRKYLALLFVIGVPYVRTKMKYDQTENSMVQKVAKVLDGGVRMVEMVFKWKYLFHRSKYYYASDRILNMMLVRYTNNDAQLENAKRVLYRRKVLEKVSIGESVVKLYWRLYDNSMMIALVGYLVYRYLRLSEEEKNSNSEKETWQLDVPPPERPVLSVQVQAELDTLPKNACFICRRKKTNEAASNSGYVFCYPCVYNYVNEYEKCPITQKAMQVDEIRRIYESAIE